MHNTIFISDLHLSKEQPEITKLFLKFLSDDCSQADAIYILGDLFVLWVGDDYEDDLSKIIKTELKKITVPIYIMPGNRDFILGKKFAKECGAILISDPHLIDLYGKAALLTHGDILCTKDYLQRIFRYCTQGSVAKKIFLKLPLKIRLKMANIIRKISLKNNMRKSVQIMDISPKQAAKLLKIYNADLVIHGHTHKFGVYPLHSDSSVYQRIVLPNWLKEKGGFLQYYENGSFTFVDLKLQ